MLPFRRISSPAAIIVCAGILFACPAPASGDWALWRGPNQDGTASGGGVFDTGGFGLSVRWQQPIGSGYSGIAVAGDRVLTMDSDEGFDYLVALSATDGSELWRYEIEPVHKGHDGSDDGPISTPVVVDDTVYGLGATGKLFAVGLKDGAEVWSIDLKSEFDSHVPFYGFATQPLVLGKMLYLQTGAPEGRFLTAFDRKTGEVSWSVGDDTTGYQSPVLATLAGERQILAAGNKSLFGVSPASGKILWSHEYRTADDDGSTQPVLLGEDRFLLVLHNDSVAYRVEQDGSGFSLDELWRSTALKGSLATPVVYEGQLYGFDGNFLTCIDIATGEKVWKSRPPGGNGLIRVDGHLVIYASDGRIVVVAASPEGYREEASLEISELGTYTYPSFADGNIFVRNLSELYRIGVTDTPTIAEAAPKPEPDSEFARFVAEVEASDNKRALVDDFMNAQPKFPVQEGDDLVHFIYRGDVEDVAITGNMTDYFAEEAMNRVAGTDLYYKTYRLEPGSRIEYRLNVDFENLGPDPLNPRRVPGNFGDMSELAMGGWSAPDHVKAYRGSSPGSLETFQLKSEILGNEREITVYLPPGYAGSDARYPLLLVNEGEEWLEFGNMTNSLNNLIGQSVSPLIVVYINSLDFRVARQELSGDQRADYARMLVEELLPRVEASYRTVAKREARAVMGYTGGAFAALYAALEYPDVFGMAGMQSFWLQRPVAEELMQKLAERRSPAPRFDLVWYRYDLQNPDFSFDLKADSMSVAEAIEKAGYELTGGEVPGGAGWGAWRAHVGDMLELFFPVE